MSTAPKRNIAQSTSGRYLGLMVLAGLAVLVCCNKSPTEVYRGAFQAKQAKEYNKFLTFFTDRSQVLLGRMQEQQHKGNELFMYMEDLFDVLPSYPDVTDEKIEGNLCLLSVGLKNAKETVILLREEVGWGIDIIESPRFWRPLVVDKHEAEKGP